MKNLLLVVLFRNVCALATVFSYLGQGLTLRESDRRIYQDTIDRRVSIYGMKSDHAAIVLDRTVYGLDAGAGHQNIRISV